MWLGLWFGLGPESGFGSGSGWGLEQRRARRRAAVAGHARGSPSVGDDLRLPAGVVGDRAPPLADAREYGHRLIPG